MNHRNTQFYYDEFYDDPPYRSTPRNHSRKRCKPYRKRKGRFSSLIVVLVVCVLLIGGLSLFGDQILRNLPPWPNEPSSYSPNQAHSPQDSSQPYWALLLVNQDNALPKGYAVETTTLDNGEAVDTRIYPALQKMFDDMRADGIYPVVASGFRTQEKQQQIMDEKVQTFRTQGYSKADAQKEAEKWVALPGYSEHQTGLAVDINADGIHSAGHEVYDWLAKHAYQYGFIKRYPEDKIEITGVSNEPWHYRYVGTTAAKEMVQRNVCLEEYLGK